MSLRSDPTVEPSRPDPVTRNQPEMEKVNTNEQTGTGHMPGNYPPSSRDSTASGGYGAGPEEVWSNKAQRGSDKPVNGLIDQATDGTDLKDELQDAKQGRDTGSFESNDEWGVEKGADKDF